jgi:hypothetical protein
MDTTHLTKFEITIENKNNQLTTDEEKELFDYIKQRIEGKDVKIPEKLIDCVAMMELIIIFIVYNGCKYKQLLRKLN